MLRKETRMFICVNVEIKRLISRNKNTPRPGQIPKSLVPRSEAPIIYYDEQRIQRVSVM